MCDGSALKIHERMEMRNMEDKWFDLFFKYIHDMADLNEFSEWIYNSGCTEKILGKDGYFDYQDFYYMQKYETSKIDIFLKETLKKYSIENYRRIEVKWLVEKIMDGKISLCRGSYILYELSKLGYDFISHVFGEYVLDEKYFSIIRYSQRLNEEIKRLQTILKCNECLENSDDMDGFSTGEDADGEVLLIRSKNPNLIESIDGVLIFNSIPAYIKCLEPYDVSDMYYGNIPLGFEIYVPAKFYERAKVLIEKY